MLRTRVLVHASSDLDLGTFQLTIFAAGRVAHELHGSGLRSDFQGDRNVVGEADADVAVLHQHCHQLGLPAALQEIRMLSGHIDTHKAILTGA